MLFGVDGADRADVGLVARRAGRAFVEVDVEDAVAEHGDHVGVRGVGVLDGPAASLDLGEEPVVVRVELVDALHRADVDARSVLHVDARFGDDCEAGHVSFPSFADLATSCIVSLIGTPVDACADRRCRCTCNRCSGSARSATAATSSETPALNFGRAAIDDAVEGVLMETTTPGAVVLLRQGDTEHLVAYETREYGGGDAVTVDDHFRIGLNTKTMTGTVILQLVDEGELALDDPVSNHVAGVPNGENITIAQLLDMRSGLHNYSELISFNRVLDEDPQKVWQPEELVAMGVAEEPYFPPGEGYHFSNTNTVLLGMIIEEVTGNSVGDEFRRRIFEPLGLEHTLLPGLDDPSIPDPHPNGYLWGTNESTAVDPALPERRAGGRARRRDPAERRHRRQSVVGVDRGRGHLDRQRPRHLCRGADRWRVAVDASSRRCASTACSRSTPTTRSRRSTGSRWPSSDRCSATTVRCPGSSRSWDTTRRPGSR